MLGTCRVTHVTCGTGYLQRLLIVHEDEDTLQVCSMYASAHSIHSMPPRGRQVHMLQLWRQVWWWRLGCCCIHKPISVYTCYSCGGKSGGGVAWVLLHTQINVTDSQTASVHICLEMCSLTTAGMPICYEVL